MSEVNAKLLGEEEAFLPCRSSDQGIWPPLVYAV